MAQKSTHLEVIPSKGGGYFIHEKSPNGQVTVVGESSPKPSKAEARCLRLIERMRGPVVVRVLDAKGKVVREHKFEAAPKVETKVHRFVVEHVKKPATKKAAPKKAPKKIAKFAKRRN